MKIIYRLEDSAGNGPFFYRNGQNRIFPDLFFEEDRGLHGFINKNRFKEPSYIEFYKSSDFYLYKIKISKSLYENKYGEILFNENDIISKRRIRKW
jgi:hypothetical protein